jgi:hypothetical protein
MLNWWKTSSAVFRTSSSQEDPTFPDGKREYFECGIFLAAAHARLQNAIAVTSLWAYAGALDLLEMLWV